MLPERLDHRRGVLRAGMTILSLGRLACRIPELFLIQDRGRQRHPIVEQMSQVRTERELGNNRNWSEKPATKVIRNGAAPKVGPERWLMIYI